MFRGNFKFNSANGNKLMYSNGDVVLHQGKLYKSRATTQNSPLQAPKDWEFIALSEPFRGTNPPANPKENQIWISDDGVSYVYFYDGIHINGFLLDFDFIGVIL